MLKKIKTKRLSKHELFDRFEYYIDEENPDVEVRKVFYNKKYKTLNNIEKFCNLALKNNKSNFVANETWFKNGKEHRDGDLPSYISYFQDGEIKQKIWRRDGIVYRADDKPTVEFYNGSRGTYEELQKFYAGELKLTNQLHELEWHKDGKLGRNNDLPSVIDYYGTGELKAEQWFENGKRHRDSDLPSMICYHKNNSVDMKIWYRNGQIHRDNDLPARIVYYKNGSIKAEYWLQDDILYRENNKPTYIYYNYRSGTIKEEKYDTGIKLYQLK
ncbi:hypothetical protein OD350_22365 [Clostridium beijerinckii]|uniref:hypothetical protein n=1 Tax=Clostridium beijerinckii TaxID=1520 RepID=UPI0022262048|nr:hypothetical protein [Clostridium beijerinckii]UYZ34966.1 hypothetical protein OD350_22365 [Clostridium beijerinckii]